MENNKWILNSVNLLLSNNNLNNEIYNNIEPLVQIISLSLDKHFIEVCDNSTSIYGLFVNNKLYNDQKDEKSEIFEKYGSIIKLLKFNFSIIPYSNLDYVKTIPHKSIFI